MKILKLKITPKQSSEVKVELTQEEIIFIKKALCFLFKIISFFNRGKK